MTCAFFDLDHTLLDGDSNCLWLDELAARGLVDARATAQRQADYLRQYAQQTLDVADYLRFHLGLLAGQPLAFWAPIRDDFVTRQIAPRIGAAARQAVARHAAQGQRVVIVSATHRFLVDGIAQLLGMQAIASEVEKVGHGAAARLSGQPLLPACFREHKIDGVQRWLAHHGLPADTLAGAAFYSDSANDAALLGAVGQPVAVNPDPALAALARQRGWPVQHWRS